MPPLSGHQTTLPTVHSGWSARDLDCTMTELHSEGWKGWAYEYQNSWAICDVNRIYCNLVGAARFHATDTKLGISVQPNYPHTRYVGLHPTTTHPYTHTHTRARARAHTPKVRVYYTSAHPLTVDLLNISASSLAVS